MKRKCSGTCQKTKDISNYHRTIAGKGGYSARCITCTKSARKVERPCELNVKMVTQFLKYGFLT